MFEYLMPLLVMRSYPDTLLDESCRMVVRRQIEYAAARGVPWGISESAYNVVDRHDTYQYKAFGVPGLGLKRGLGDELVVAPYATALAAMIDPAAERRQPAAAGRARASRATTGSSTPIDYTAREADRRRRRARGRRPRGTVVRAYFAHHAGHDAGRAGQRAARRPMVEALSRRPARAGHRAAAAGARAAPHADDSSRGRSTRCASSRRRPPTPVRRYRSPHTVVPARAVPVERQLRDGRHQRRRRRAASAAAWR